MSREKKYMGMKTQKQNLNIIPFLPAQLRTCGARMHVMIVLTVIYLACMVQPTMAQVWEGQLRCQGTYRLTPDTITHNPNKFMVYGSWDTQYNGIVYESIGDILIDNIDEAYHDAYSNDFTMIRLRTTHPITISGTITVKSGLLQICYDSGYGPTPGQATFKRKNTGKGHFLFNIEPKYTLAEVVGNPNKNDTLVMLEILGQSGADYANNLIIDGGSNITYDTTAHTFSCSDADLDYNWQLMRIGGGTVNLNQVTFRNNWKQAGVGCGAAIYIDGAAKRKMGITLNNCLFEKLHDVDYGAAMLFTVAGTHADGSFCKMNRCTMRYCFNTSSQYGESDNSLNGRGGAIRCYGTNRCTLDVTDSEFHHNYAQGQGGAIQWNAALIRPVSLKRCSFHHNWAGRIGGAIKMDAGVELEACSFTNNIADWNGGAIVLGTFLTGGAGHTDQGGGVWYPHDGVLELDSETVIRGNRAGRNGGAIYITADFITNTDSWATYLNSEYQPFKMVVNVNGATIQNNTADGYGGAVYMTRSTDFYGLKAYLNYGTITGNTAGEGGGAFYMTEDLVDETHHIVYTPTTGPCYGQTLNYYAPSCVPAAGYYNYNRPDAPSLTYHLVAQDILANIGTDIAAQNPDNEDLVVTNNHAKNGGGLYVKNGKNNIFGNTLVNLNQVTNYGGFLYSENGSITLTNGTIMNNSAGIAGGGIYFDATSTMTVGSGAMTIKDNTANSAPNNIHLVDGNTIAIASGATFDPVYVGVYTANRTPNIPVFTGTVGQLSTIYDGMSNGTMNVYDDSQQFNPIDPDGGTILYFGDSPWSVLQQTVNTLPAKVNNVYQIGTVKELTAFLWLVNNIDTHHDFNTDLGEDEQTHPEASARLTADINMEGHYWEPIANYEGTFDGNGYTISRLTMVPTNKSDERGMFGVNTSGTIKNVNLRNGYFGGDGDYIGTIVYQMDGGSLYNSVAQCQMLATDETTTAGGLVGHINGGTVHSSIATCEMTGYTMGGLAGKITTGNLYNNFANPLFTYSGPANPADPSEAYFVGGLVADNAGTVANCYVRFSRTQSLTGAKFGQLAGSNTGTINPCYTPEVFTSDVPSTIVQSGSATSSTYKITDTPYLYNRPNNNLVGSTGMTLAEKLNDWIPANSDYSPWNRTTAGGWSYTYSEVTYTGGILNDDYPMPKMKGLSNVASADGFYFEYAPSLNRTLDKYNVLTGGGTVWLYASPKNADGTDEEVDEDNDSDVLLYIDEDASLLQDDDSHLTAYTSQMLRTYSSAGGNRWHNLSSPLKQSYIGISYSNTGTVNFSWAADPCGVQFSGNEDQALFPSDIEVDNMDLYCFYEPEYHWINFRRNSLSHWHENDHSWKIDYIGNGIKPIDASDPDDSSNGNEAYLVPGKGYLVSIDQDQLVQNKGELNNGNVTLYNVTKTDDNAWAERLGFNLLGNPYQSYLDFEVFITQNSSSLWSGTSEYNNTYACYDPSLKSYVQYKNGVSYDAKTASQYIHPHQGFFIRKTAPESAGTTVTYTNAMRTNTSEAQSTFRGDSQPAYPLINLMVRDSEGNGDVAVLELDRATDEGAEKMRLGECKGLLSLGYEGKEYGILFRSEIGEYQSLHFTAREEGTFTLTWEPMNGEFSELTLVDNIAGTRTDMLARDSYVFEGNPDQYASRFKIMIGDYKDIDEHDEDGPSTGSGTFAFQMGNEIVVNGEGRLEMIDMLGRIVRTEQLNGSQSTVSLPGTTGVYVLRLTGKGETRVQKMVVE